MGLPQFGHFTLLLLRVVVVAAVDLDATAAVRALVHAAPDRAVALHADQTHEAVAVRDVALHRLPLLLMRVERSRMMFSMSTLTLCGCCLNWSQFSQSSAIPSMNLNSGLPSSNSSTQVWLPQEQVQLIRTI